MARITPLTADRITGEIAPCGVITGFRRPTYKSPWPSGQDNGPLTDRKITKYAKSGRYYAMSVSGKLTKKDKPRTKKNMGFI